MHSPQGLVNATFKSLKPINLTTSEVFTSLDKGLIEATNYMVLYNNYERVDKICQRRSFCKKGFG